ncbi:MAG: hypothetical protein JWN41_996 [Thermoleophilia bacterium]|nr:hypothetical protein [Thermoleophilia bacterium]
MAAVRAGIHAITVPLRGRAWLAVLCTAACVAGGGVLVLVWSAGGRSARDVSLSGSRFVQVDGAPLALFDSLKRLRSAPAAAANAAAAPRGAGGGTVSRRSSRLAAASRGGKPRGQTGGGRGTTRPDGRGNSGGGNSGGGDSDGGNSGGGTQTGGDTSGTGTTGGGGAISTPLPDPITPSTPTTGQGGSAGDVIPQLVQPPAGTSTPLLSEPLVSLDSGKKPTLGNVASVPIPLPTGQLNLSLLG